MFSVRHVGKAGLDILESAANARVAGARKFASPSRPTGSASNCTWFHLIPLNSTYFHFPALGGWPPGITILRDLCLSTAISPFANRSGQSQFKPIQAIFQNRHVPQPATPTTTLGSPPGRPERRIAPNPAFSLLLFHFLPHLRPSASSAGKCLRLKLFIPNHFHPSASP